MSDYRPSDIYTALKRLNLAKDRPVFMHSSLMHIGLIKDVSIQDQSAAVIAAVQEALGSTVTLCMPAPDWDYGLKGIPFDLRHSPVTRSLGVVSRYFVTLPGRHRSPNPIFSVAALGPEAAFICDTGTASAFGADSAWDRLFQRDADMLFYGCTLAAMTFTRYIESRFGVPYLYVKRFTQPILNNGQEIFDGSTALLRYMHCPVIYNFDKTLELFRNRGVLRSASLGNGEVHALRMSDVYAIAIEALKKDLHIFLEHLPDYKLGELPCK